LIVDVAIRAENRAGRILSMPVDLEFALHVPDPNHQGNEIDASATRAAEEVLRSLAGQRYVVGEVVTPLSLVKVARPQSIESNVALPVISYLLVEHFPD
jgi:hypothetical protein